MPGHGSRWLAALVVTLGVSGCARLTQISEEGGLVGRVLARAGDADGPGAVQPPSPSVPAAPAPERGLPVPYRPDDFHRHADNGELAWHWTVARGQGALEVKGLIENRGPQGVRSVILGIRTPDGLKDVELPGLIRPGQRRPFYVRVGAGEADDAELVVLAVDRADPGDDPRFPGATSRAPAAPPADSRPPADHGYAHLKRDHFFTLRWNTLTKGGETEVSGVVENRNGPVFRDVTLEMSAYGPSGLLGTERLVLRGPLDKKASRPFSINVSTRQPVKHVVVDVASYEFYQPRDR